MARGVKTVDDGDAGEPAGDSGGGGVAVGEQIEFPIDAEPSGDGGTGGGSSDDGGAAPVRRKRRTRAQIEAETAGAVPSRVSSDIRGRIIDFSKMLQRRFGGYVLVQDRHGQVQPQELWVLSREEADAISSAIDGVRSKLPLMPEKWALPVAAAWLGGVVLWSLSSRVTVYRQLQAQAAGQMAAQQHQQTAQAGYHPNGTTPDVVNGIPVTPDGEAPPDWDAALRGF